MFTKPHALYFFLLVAQHVKDRSPAALLPLKNPLGLLVDTTDKCGE
jgi:hypothetical protein